MSQIRPVGHVLDNMTSRVHPYQNIDMGTRIYLGRDHHYSFVDWVRAFREGSITKNSLLVHIDAHSDLGKPFPIIENSLITIPTVDGAKQYLLKLEEQDMPEGCFIAPAMVIGLVGRMIQVADDSYNPSQGDVFLNLQNLKDGVLISDLKLVKSAEPEPEFFNSKGSVLRVPWELIHLSSLEEAVKENTQTVILDIDIDFFNHEGDVSLPKLGAQLKNLKWNIATISLSPKYLSGQNYPAVLDRILAILRG